MSENPRINWKCPHCGYTFFAYSMSFHLYLRHGITLDTAQYSRSLYAWLRRGEHTAEVMAEGRHV